MTFVLMRIKLEIELSYQKIIFCTVKNFVCTTVVKNRHHSVIREIEIIYRKSFRQKKIERFSIKIMIP